MQALILAAGRGRRLGEKSSDLPKCLLEVGRRPLVEHQLESLAEAGIGPVAMVIGYCGDEIREVVGIRAEYIANPRWNVTNSLYSFWLARDWVKGPLLVLNSDLLFHPEILDRVLRVRGDAVAYDSSSGQGREHMKVEVRDGRLVRMEKDLPLDQNSGENVGIIALTAESARALFHRAGEILDRGEEKLWLGSAVCKLAEERRIQAVDVAGLPWGEVDFPYDLDRVRKEVLPAIRRTLWERKLHWRRFRWVALVAVCAAVLYLAYRAWFSPAVSAWATVEIETVPKVRVRAGDEWQEWWFLEEDRVTTLNVHGPSKVQVDSRLLMSQDAGGEQPYVLEITLDGKRMDWFKETAVRSRKWSHQKWSVSKRRTVRLEVEPGSHTVAVRLVASDSGACLVRVRREDPEEDD